MFATTKRSRSIRRNHGLEILERRELMAGDATFGSAYTNPANPFDVDESGEVTAADFTAIVSAINTYGPRALPDPGRACLPRPCFVDANGDGVLSAADALAVTDHLHAAKRAGTTPAPGEAEPLPSVKGPVPLVPYGPLPSTIGGQAELNWISAASVKEIGDFLNRSSSGQTPRDMAEARRFDLNRDGLVTPRDVLFAINARHSAAMRSQAGQDSVTAISTPQDLYEPWGDDSVLSDVAAGWQDG